MNGLELLGARIRLAMHKGHPGRRELLNCTGNSSSSEEAAAEWKTLCQLDI